jgi:hypothetical protein
MEYLLKVILLADPTLSGLLSLFSSLKIKKFTKSQLPNVHRSLEIRILSLKIVQYRKVLILTFVMKIVI